MEREYLNLLLVFKACNKVVSTIYTHMYTIKISFYTNAYRLSLSTYPKRMALSICILCVAHTISNMFVCCRSLALRCVLPSTYPFRLMGPPPSHLIPTQPPTPPPPTSWPTPQTLGHVEFTRRAGSRSALAYPPLLEKKTGSGF
jgi:hypothetical protein